MEKSRKVRIYSKVKRWRGNQKARKKDSHKTEQDSPKVADVEVSSPDNKVLDGNVVKLPELQQDTTPPVENSQTPEGQSYILNWFLEMADSRLW